MSQTDQFEDRKWSIRILLILASIVLAGTAFNLQVLNKKFRVQASAAAINQQVLYPSRGLVYDRQGKVLVYNVPVYDLMVVYNGLDPKMDTSSLCALLGIDKKEFSDRLNKNWRSARYSKSVPFTFAKKIPPQQAAKLEESLYQFPGFYLQARNIRAYPHECGAHVLGYIREVNDKEVLDSLQDYSPGDYIGASGLERQYESLLKGEKGFAYRLKDNLGRDMGPVSGLKDQNATSGLDMISSIDLDLQEYAEYLMAHKIGSIVAIEPKTGEILTMVSAPSYNPNAMILDNNRGKNYQALQSDPTTPLLDRAVLGQYPPGSLFKPVVALAGLQLDVIRPNQTISCPGAYYFQGMRLTGCHAHQTCTTVNQGIQHSCNAYFVTAFRNIVDKGGFYNPQVGLDTFNHYLDQFGFKQKLGIDFPIESKGSYPTSAFFDNTYKDSGGRWNSVWIRSLGIGQGELLTTNLQLANLAAAIGNRGYYITPHLVKAVGHMNQNKMLDGQSPKQWKRHRIDINPQHFEYVVDGMKKVVSAGTGGRAYLPDIAICGKTGTAENAQRNAKDHSIFFAFAPKDDPQIAIAVYVENGGFGGTYAAPISSLLIEKYLQGEIRDSRKWLEKQMHETNLIDLP